VPEQMTAHGCSRQSPCGRLPASRQEPEGTISYEIMQVSLRTAMHTSKFYRLQNKASELVFGTGIFTGNSKSTISQGALLLVGANL
jgi:hypothetical protein